MKTKQKFSKGYKYQKRHYLKQAGISLFLAVCSFLGNAQEHMDGGVTSTDYDFYLINKDGTTGSGSSSDSALILRTIEDLGTLAPKTHDWWIYQTAASKSLGFGYSDLFSNDPVNKVEHPLMILSRDDLTVNEDLKVNGGYGYFYASNSPTNSISNYIRLGHGGSHSFIDSQGIGNLHFRYNNKY